MSIPCKKFTVVENWGKKNRGKPIRGVLYDRLPSRTLTVMERIWLYLHTTGSHGLMKKSSRIAEDRMRRMKHNQYC